jgi:hypothetical protein
MPIFANNFIDKSKLVEEIKLVEISPPAATPINEVIEAQETEDHNILIVNGKAKKVSKHSAYMLDMLTIDIE